MMSQRLISRLILNNNKGVRIVGGSSLRLNKVLSMSTMVEKTKEQKTVVLPRLPVPGLEETLTKYLRTVKPLLSSQEFDKTRKIVEQFGTMEDQGPKLQGLLENRANSMDNWMAEWWLNTAYLEYREPLIIFSSPGLVFPLQSFKSLDNQLSYASKMMYGALLYKQFIDEGRIKPDFMGKVPLDMSQYNKIFGTTRTPMKPRDVLIYNQKSKHVVVAYKNYFFRLDIVDNKDGKLKDPNQFYAELKNIVESTEGLSGVPIGILTTEKRDKWADVYELLKKDPKNTESLKVIESSLFILSLDKPNRDLSLSGMCSDGNPINPEIEDLSMSERQTIAALQMVHGNTTNSGNRWFDKTISFVVGTDGEVGLTYEHSPAEGPPIANMMDFIVHFMKEIETQDLRMLPSRTEMKVKPLEFNLNDKKIIEAIAEAKDNLDKLIKDLQMSAFTFKKYGREFIKSCSFSPDSFIQIGIQAAFYKLHKEPGAHYESASVRMYKEGRTECIRSCSLEALEFSKALVDTSLSLQDKFKLMKNAIEGHKKYASDAVQGMGVDRHLLGLRKIAVENGLEIPDLYKDKGYLKSGHFRLSTSQVPSLYEAFMCYGPLTNDGYGCCYNPIKNGIVFGLSAFKSNPETDANKFKHALQQTLVEMEKVGNMRTMESSKL